MRKKVKNVSLKYFDSKVYFKVIMQANNNEMVDLEENIFPKALPDARAVLARPVRHLPYAHEGKLVLAI